MARSCSECVFWEQLREFEGMCHRHAPPSARRSDEVAHWPQTHARQGCGEGRIASTRPGASCGACMFWRGSSAGLNPVDRGDMPKAWWTHAGHCVRSAPQPSAEPGPRAFWLATSADDGCGDGVAAPPAQSNN